MENIDGHIIDLDLMSSNGWVLDAGCRGFELKEKLGNGFKYLCLDPDIKIKSVKGIVFENIALMPYDGTVGYCGWSTGEGNYCYKESAVHYAETDVQVQCLSLKTLMDKYDIECFELAKLDIEGSEYDLLLSINFHFAKQISVEFHDACGHNHYGTHQEYIMKLMDSPFGGLYKIVESYEYPEIKGMYEYLFKLK